jgi:hypothetical protein
MVSSRYHVLFSEVIDETHFEIAFITVDNSRSEYCGN